MLDNWLAGKLADRQRSDMMRTLPTPNNLLDFTSNDYLGLARSEALYQLIKETVAQLPRINGAAGSRLLAGNSVITTKVETKLASIFRSPSALLFNSGYSANLAVLSSIPQKDDFILYDERAHASIKDGARLSLAKKYSFRHNDLNDLEKKIQRSKGRIFVVAESVYSMDGDECPLEALVKLAQQYDLTIILDEAHSTGVRGPQGSGSCVEKSLHDKVAIRIYTFGKGMGVCGACVAGSEQLINYLINYARPFIYTTAPSQHAVASIGCAFDFLSENIHLQQKLNEKIRCFNEGAEGLPGWIKSPSSIQTLIIPGNTAVRRSAHALQNKGFDVRPILSPTVPKGSERLRICLHTYNTDDQITSLKQSLNDLL